MCQSQDVALVRDVEAGRADLDLAVALQVAPSPSDHVRRNPGRKHLITQRIMSSVYLYFSMRQGQITLN